MDLSAHVLTSNNASLLSSQRGRFQLRGRLAACESVQSKPHYFQGLRYAHKQRGSNPFRATSEQGPVPKTMIPSMEVDQRTELEMRQQSAREWINNWRARSLEQSLPSNPSWNNIAMEYAHWAAALGVLYIANKGLAEACLAAGIKFPSALIGMFGIVGTLFVLAETAPAAAEKVYKWFMPAVNWIARWLPLFYVPSLVTLPLALQGIPGEALAKMMVILVGGMVASLAFTAQSAVTIRQLVNTTMEPQQPEPKLPPFTLNHYLAWGAIFGASLAATAVSPSTLGPLAALPCGLSATVFGYLVGTALPAGLRSVLHPIITCAAVANLGVGLQGWLTGTDYSAALQVYLAKGAGPMGAGDLLMSFLGVVILSFGFKIYSQRRLMQRHAPEIFGATTLSALFSLFGTATACHFMGLPSDLSRALVPRSVTVALAIPIAQQLNTPDVSITAAAVVTTGLLGANFCQTLLNIFKYKDPIARGLATAGSAHGLGTAALAAKEPEALPFCALAYALIGVISSVLAGLPFIQAAIISITG